MIGDLTNTTSDFSANNSFSNESLGDNTFFQIYFSSERFLIETLLATVATVMNLFVVCAIWQAGNFKRRRTSIYNVLFANLAFVNTLSCIQSWFSNNLVYLFKRYFAELTERNFCLFSFHILSALLVSCCFSLVGALTMIAFSGVQLQAIRQPLRRYSFPRRKRVLVFIGVSWLTCIIALLFPISVLLPMVLNKPCGRWLHDLILRVLMYIINVSMATQLILYAMNAVYCLKIYQRIQEIRREVTRFRFEHSMRSERRAFATIATLLITLNLFFIPYMIIHIVTLNTDSSSLIGNQVVIYFMNMLPYLKYSSDPVIYGIRMRELNGCFMKATTTLSFCSCKRQSAPLVPLNSAKRSTSSVYCMTSLNDIHDELHPAVNNVNVIELSVAVEV